MCNLFFARPNSLLFGVWGENIHFRCFCKQKNRKIGTTIFSHFPAMESSMLKNSKWCRWGGYDYPNQAMFRKARPCWKLGSKVSTLPTPFISRLQHGYLVGGWTNPSEKYATVTLNHETQVSGWKCQKIFELPPPRKCISGPKKIGESKIRKWAT